MNTGTLHAGHSVTVDAKNIVQQGNITADSGSIEEDFTGAYYDNVSAITNAPEGTISLLGSGRTAAFSLRETMT